MLLETYENLLELYVKQLVFLVVSITIKYSKFDFPLVCEKPDVHVCSEVRYFSYPTRVIVKKAIINPNHYSKGLPKSFPANYSKKFV